MKTATQENKTIKSGSAQKEGGNKFKETVDNDNVKRIPMMTMSPSTEDIHTYMS